MMEDEKVNENGKKSTAQIDETPNEDGTQNKNSEKDKEENLSDSNMPRVNKIETSETTPVSENNTDLADVHRQPGDGKHEIKEAVPNPGDDVKTNDVVEEDDGW